MSRFCWSDGHVRLFHDRRMTAALALVVIAWAMLRYSQRLPIGQFFRYSAFLIAVLAVVLIGKSVSALQEAGYLPITWFEGGLRIELLGLYPTLQGIAAQVGIAILLAIGFFLSNRSRQAAASKR